MSGYEANTTTTMAYDYSSYYGLSEEDDFAPCKLTELRDFGRIFLPTVYSLVFILGFIGNALVLCVLLKHRNQTSLTDICLLNLAVSDLLFVFTLPFWSSFVVAGQWTFGNFMCSFASGSHSTGFYCSIFCIVVMTIERYMAIIHAHRMAHLRTVRAGVVLSVVMWMLSFGVSLPVFIFTKVNESDLTCSYDTQSGVWRHYHVFTANILGLFIPLLVMVFCYSRIIPIVMKMKSMKKHRVVKLIISIMVVFFLFWGPYNISLLLNFMKSKLPGDVCTLEKNLRLSTTVTETFAYIHCCLNPIIYAFVGQKFMKRVLKLLKNCIPCIPSTYTSDLSSDSYRKSSAISRSSEITSTFVK
ncbi:C-C chemokine receptor type 4 [Xyrichtys novacula]|uniref:C-C chemokine receptor type 4 n=1 Tax=Xyrichtys novacula TaxID=13765 RepID=A0AAV1FMB8_XYRNO|nr:C-C chemokine receptor type 4 [Xyrichtys novacula]